MLGPGCRARLEGSWQAAERVPRLLAKAPSTKGTSDVLLIPAARGSAPFTSGLSWEPEEGKPGLYWRKPHFQHLPKVSAGLFCFPHPLPSDEVGLIPARFAKLCLAKASSLCLRGLMGTVWMERQLSPRFRGGAEVIMHATFSITGSPSFSTAGEGSQKPCSGGESSWQGTVQPRAVPGQLVFPPQDVPRLQIPEETSSDGVFIPKPMDL